MSANHITNIDFYGVLVKAAMSAAVILVATEVANNHFVATENAKKTDLLITMSAPANGQSESSRNMLLSGVFMQLTNALNHKPAAAAISSNK